MFGVHDWSEANRRFHREEQKKAEIARDLDMSRTTLDRLLFLKDPPQYRRRPMPSLLDDHKEAILAMLNLDAEVASTVVLEHIRKDGYPGGRTILKDYLQDVRPRFLAAQGYQRTTYAPGEIGQFDWWELQKRIPVGKGRHRKTYGLVTTLPHSSAHAVVFSHSKTMDDFIACFPGCLERLGGVPENVVGDNDSSVVEPRIPRRPAKLHEEVAALFGHLRTQAVILDPGKPESKGHAERMIEYFETSFLPLRQVENIEDLQNQFDTWTIEIAFERYHRRVGGKVADALNVERGFLHRLPDPLPSTDRHFEVRVSKDCFIRVGDVDYSVPPGLIGRRVQVRMSPKELHVHIDGTQIARHVRSYVPADVVLAPEHVRAMRLSREARGRLDSNDVEIEIPDLRRYDALVGVNP